MKTIIFNIFTVLFICQTSFAFTEINTFNVVKRNNKFKAKIVPVQLKNLISTTSFNGKYIKVVEGKSDAAINFNANEELLLRAATVYYHASIARDYFANTLGSEFVKNHPKIIMRLNITNQFNDLGHFANDNLDPQYNNAVTIPPGNGFPSRNIPGWNTEIWFRPAKKIHYKDLGSNLDQNVEFQVLLKQFRKQSHITSLQRFLSSAILGTLETSDSTILNVLNIAGSSVVAELAYQTSGSLTKLFSRKWFHLDSALVPEIIYHEFTHLAFYEILGVNNSTPVLEGIADYFAATIAGKGELATRIKKYNTFNGKKADNSLEYKELFETTDYANADFVLGLLWELRSIFGDKGADQFLFRMVARLDSSSTIRIQLLDAILNESRATMPLHNVNRYKLYRLFYSKGF